MPVVTIQQGPRTLEQKRELVRSVTEAFVVALGIPADAVQIWIAETAPESWAQGGVLTAERR